MPVLRAWTPSEHVQREDQMMRVLVSRSASNARQQPSEDRDEDKHCARDPRRERLVRRSSHVLFTRKPQLLNRLSGVCVVVSGDAKVEVQWRDARQRDDREVNDAENQVETNW
jgi:hypothetical protein